MGFALVLAGGGVTGIAWELGVLLGLRDAGVDVVASSGLDLVVGTSAGSAVGAQVLSGVDLADLYDRQLGPHQELTPDLDFDELIRVFMVLARNDRKDPKVLQRVGTMALEATTPTEAERRAVIEWRLPNHDWPSRGPGLKITAIDAETGELAVFDATTGVPLVDAVAASCAVPGVWPPVTIGGHRYIDGGVRSIINADLAATDTLVVLAPMSGPGAAELDPELEPFGDRVALVLADDAATEAMGPNALDPERRADAAAHGRRQGNDAAARVQQLLDG